MSAAPYQATANAMQGNPYVAPPLAEPWKQLQRVSIPTFSGDKRTYESFRAAFMECVHSAPASPEYKLLQLRQYVSGEALTAIESLGFSPAAYQEALDLLNRKYGGARRRVALQLEELDKFPAVSFRRADELERFTELLTVAVVNLKDTGRVAELEAGTFYTRLLQKCDKYSLTQFHRWRHENRKLESVEVLLEWLTLETEFSVMSAETVHGLGRAKPPEQQPQRPVHEYRPQTSGHRMTPGRYPGHRTFFASSSSGGEGTKNNCTACNGLHGVWSCAAFKFMQPNQRWTMAKKGNLCYRCLDSGHRGTDCSKTMEDAVKVTTVCCTRLLSSGTPKTRNLPAQPRTPHKRQEGEAWVGARTGQRRRHRMTYHMTCLMSPQTAPRMNQRRQTSRKGSTGWRPPNKSRVLFH